ncbi:MAG: hypothetical protein WBC53_07090, partial [Phycisphaerae bacterium]
PPTHADVMMRLRAICAAGYEHTLKTSAARFPKAAVTLRTHASAGCCARIGGPKSVVSPLRHRRVPRLTDFGVLRKYPSDPPSTLAER